VQENRDLGGDRGVDGRDRAQALGVSSPSAAPTSRSPEAGLTGPIEANSASSLASGSLQAHPAPGDSDVSLGAWSAFTLATVATPGVA
jgi:hypothetical protein